MSVGSAMERTRTANVGPHGRTNSMGSYGGAENDGGDFFSEPMEGCDGEEGGNNSPTSSSSLSSPMFNIPSVNPQFRTHQAALDHFYAFAQSHETFGISGRKESSLSFHCRALGGVLHFMRFETQHMEGALEIVKREGIDRNVHRMGCTGGGAHKYESMWRDGVGIEMVKHGEMECLVKGVEFLLGNGVGECYTYSDVGTGRERKSNRDKATTGESYPYIVVSIGTGVSLILVTGPNRNQFQRVSGSTIGGGTYLGLCKLLTKARGFDELLAMAGRGRNEKVDMLVKDIYGEDKEALDKLKLPGEIVASSFGKMASKKKVLDVDEGGGESTTGVGEEDLARALLMMCTNNIGHVAYLTSQIYGTNKIYFVGNFLRHNDIAQRRLSFSIDYWSKGQCKGQCEGLFLEHKGYLGLWGLSCSASPGVGTRQQRLLRRASELTTSRGGRGEEEELQHGHWGRGGGEGGETGEEQQGEGGEQQRQEDEGRGRQGEEEEDYH